LAEASNANYLEFTQTVTIVVPSVTSHCENQPWPRTINSIVQILLDLLGPEGCNEWFSDDLSAGDEDTLSAAVPSSSNDSFEMENICKTAPLSLEGFQSYLAAIVHEAAIQDRVPNLDLVKSLPMPTGPGGTFIGSCRAQDR
jgi:hypothetical protein